MEGLDVPDQEQLLQFLRRLKEVFDVCDEDADGFIRVEHLVDLGLQFGQGDEVRGGRGAREGQVDRTGPWSSTDILRRFMINLASAGHLPLTSQVCSRRLHGDPQLEAS
ncbi:Rab11 family-interacting protein 4A [Liparis tanakae]|uniref:Rab11 family-interacting protein 4A n=1 Tax=Liparis tanakae TaxID=230148 RepID=A0A4Z2G889_9TELE|nr:Rab11 family-interacting protein 4A [Liparis tanakae]